MNGRENQECIYDISKRQTPIWFDDIQKTYTSLGGKKNHQAMTRIKP